MIRIAGDVSIPRALLSNEQVRRDWYALSVPNPARVQAERLGDPRAWRHPARVSLLIEDGELVRYPVVRRDVWAPRARGAGVEIVDARPTFEREELACSVELFPYQQTAVDALIAHLYGGLVAPPGSGKSEAIAAVVARLGLPTLVVSGQVDLANDLASRLSSRLSIDVGRIGAGVFDVRRISVATIQSLDPGVIDRIKALFGCLIVDEGHHAAAESYLALSRALRVRRRYWLSATPRTDGLQPFVDSALGPVRHTVTRRELEAAGRASAPTLVRIETRFAFDYQGRHHWGPLQDALIDDRDRNALIVAELAKRCGRGVLGAAITGRVAHAETLAAMLTTAGFRAVVLTGKTPKRQRTATLDAARRGEIDVLCASTVFDEGIDLPRLSVVALTFPARHAGRIAQRVGRALRIHSGKPSPVVLDFVDVHVGPLRHQARARARVFAGQWPHQEKAA